MTKIRLDDEIKDHNRLIDKLKVMAPIKFGYDHAYIKNVLGNLLKLIPESKLTQSVQQSLRNLHMGSEEQLDVTRMSELLEAVDP